MRKSQSAYNSIFDHENRDIGPKQAVNFNVFDIIHDDWLGPSPPTPSWKIHRAIYA